MPRPIALAAALLALWLLCAAPAGASAGWTWPVAGEVITGYRNGDDPYAGGQHRGIDIAADPGTPVGAAAGGIVRFAGTAGSSGLTVSVRTSDGRLDTSYLHLSEVTVREGDAVAGGDRLGAVGVSGRRSAHRPHLHFGVREAGTRHAYVDPLNLLGPLPAPGPEPPGAAPLPEPLPVPVAPAPAPVRLPVRTPLARRVPGARRVRFPFSRRVPAGRRLPAARRLPLRRRGPSPAAVGAPWSAPALGPLRALGRGEAVQSARGAPLADRGRLPGLGPRTAAALATAPAARAPAVDAHPGNAGDRLSLGRAIACLGLLLVAALMGRAREGGPRAAEGRADRRAQGLARVRARSSGPSIARQ